MIPALSLVTWCGQVWKVDAHSGVDKVVLIRWVDDGAASGWSTRVAPVAEVQAVSDSAPDDFPLLW